MKKLIMMAAVAVVALVGNAATVTWGSGTVFGPADATGTMGSGAAARLLNADVTMYIYTVSSADYAKLTAGTANAYDNYFKASATAAATTVGGTGSNGQLTSVTTTANASETVYAAVLVTYTDADGKMWYLNNYASTTINDLGANASIGNLARYTAGSSSNGAVGNWLSETSDEPSEDVPEPTSGLLLLVGAAALALRRKQA